MEFIWHTYKKNVHIDQGEKGWMRNWIGYAKYAEPPCELRYEFYIAFTPVCLAFVQQIFWLQI